MRNTPYKGYALYEPDASPDLTETGEYNTALMAVDADMHDEEQVRLECDIELDTKFTGELKIVKQGLTSVGNGLTAEQKARADADTALGKRIDNAEVEISANSADLTGIKGLTYGDTHVNFLENSNGEYSSPALEEIRHEIETRGFRVFNYDALPDNAFATLSETWPMCCVYKAPILLFPGTKTDSCLTFTNTYSLSSSPMEQKINYITVNNDGTKSDVQALPSALTIMQLSEFGELTDTTGSTHSAIGDGNAEAYAKLMQAWPSVIVVEGGTSWRCGMYTPSRVEQAGYILVKSANTIDSAIQMRIHGGGFSGAITLEEIGG